jgi:acetylornithine deacetylase/succinyl-diaminopimelate desuccinylase-like protein
VSSNEIHDHLERNQEEHIARLQELIRQPSVSTEPDGGVPAYAELLAKRFREIGCSEAHVVDTGDDWPGVWAYYDAGSDVTIASYAYFDTYGVDESQWTLPPYEAVITSADGHPKVVAGRGSATKAPLAIWMNAVEAVAASGDGLPVNVLFLIEGAEMLGSPNFGRIVEAAGKYVDQIDALVSPRAGERTDNAEVALVLGYKNMVTFDLECDGASLGRGPEGGTIYGNGKSVVDSPTHRLVKALATLFSEDGNAIEIDGLTHLNEERVELSEADRALLGDLVGRRNGTPWNAFLPVTGGVERFTGDLDGDELLFEYLYGPSLNISEIQTAGVRDPVRLTMLLPGSARASVELRMVTDLAAQEIIDRVRAHLDARGFGDVRLIPQGVWDGHLQPSDSNVVKAFAETLEKHSRVPVLWPIQPFGGPWAHLPNQLGVPALNGGALGYGARGGGSADEYFVLESDGSVAGLVEAERFCVDLLLRFAEIARDRRSS